MDEPDTRTGDDQDLAQPPWMEYAGMVESGDPDSSLKIDEFVYGRDE